MKKSMLYICILSIMVLLVACKNKNTTSINTTSTTTELAATAEEEKGIYLGMKSDEFLALLRNDAKKCRTYIDYKRIGFCDGTDSVIAIFDKSISNGGKIIEIKRFKQPTKPVKATDLKENMNIYEVIEIIGIEDIYITSGNFVTEIYAMLEEDKLYYASCDTDINLEGNVLTFQEYCGKKPFLIWKDKVLQECEEDDGTDTSMDISLAAEAKTYKDVVAALGKPQRCTDWNMYSIILEWDIAKGDVIYEIEFSNSNNFEEALGQEVEILKIEGQQIKYLNGNWLNVQ